MTRFPPQMPPPLSPTVPPPVWARASSGALAARLTRLLSFVGVLVAIGTLIAVYGPVNSLSHTPRSGDSQQAMYRLLLLLTIGLQLASAGVLLVGSIAGLTGQSWGRGVMNVFVGLWVARFVAGTVSTLLLMSRYNGSSGYGPTVLNAVGNLLITGAYPLVLLVAFHWAEMREANADAHGSFPVRPMGG